MAEGMKLVQPLLVLNAGAAYLLPEGRKAEKAGAEGMCGTPRDLSCFFHNLLFI